MGKLVGKRTKKAVYLILAGCTILFYFAVLFFQNRTMGAEAVDKEITVSAVLGYEGYGKFGRITPASIKVTSSVHFEGVVKLVVPAQNGEKNYAYEYPISVEAGKSTTVRGDFPLTANDTLFSIQVIGQDGELYASCEQRVTTPAGQLTELYVGVVSVIENAYLSFQAQKIGEDLISNFPYVTTRAFGLSTEDIPIYSEGMDSLDMIILDVQSYLGLSEAQKTALENWANEGGIFVLEINNETSWMEAAENVSDPVEARPIFWMQIKTLERGSKAYVWIDSDQINMMEYMAENAGLAPAVFGRLCQANWVEAVVERDHYYEGSKEYEWGKTMLESSIVKRLPNMAVYVLILIAYLILTGPVLYLYLKRNDKTELTSRFVLLLSIAFSILIFLISYPTRFRKPFVQYVMIDTVQEGQYREEILFALRAPFHKAFYMGLDNSYQVRPVTNGNYYYYENSNADTALTEYQAGIYFHKDYTAVTVEKSAPFSAEYFSLQKYEPLQEKWGFEANLTRLTDTITGTVTNQSGKTLSDVILLTRERAVLLGDLNVGETIQIDEKESIFCLGDLDGKEAHRMLKVSNQTDKVQTASQQTLEKLRALKYYLKNMKMDLDSGILVGFDTETKPDWQTETDYSMQGLTLITEKIHFNRTEVKTETEELSIQDAVLIGTTMEEAQLNNSTASPLADKPGPSESEITKHSDETPKEEGENPQSEEILEQKRGMVYEYTIKSAQDLKSAVFLQNLPVSYKGKIVLFNRVTMKSYETAIGKEISDKELADCFYVQNGVTNLAVFYLSENMDESTCPVLRLQKEMVLEYTFLDEDDISVTNEADYNGQLNTTINTSIQLRYNLGDMDKLWQVIFVDTAAEKESSHYQQFSGNRYFLNIENQIFERAEDEKKIFEKENLQTYIDVGIDGNYLTVQYVSGTLNYGTEREICLPRICVVKKK